MGQEKVISLIYGIKYDQIIDISRNPFTEVNFVKFQFILGFQEGVIKGGC
jgi:hypothetical protein